MKKKPLYSLLNCVSVLFVCVFGKLKWNYPSWMIRLHLYAKNSPGRFWSLFTVAIALLLAGSYGFYWYKQLPKPVYVTASISVPQLMDNRDDAVPGNLTIDFGIQDNGFVAQSVAPIHLIGKTIKNGITMTPEIPGTWSWESDNRLLFVPGADWPAGQKYTIHVSPDFFTSDTKIEHHEFSFITHPFKAAITEFKLYQDPVNPEIRNAVATITFSHPVNPESLQKNTSLIFEAVKKGSLDLNAEPITFSYTFDDRHRVAYLHSENIKIRKSARYLLFTLGEHLKAAQAPGTLNYTISKNLYIPDDSNFLQVSSAVANIVRNAKDHPEQILNIETSIGVNEKEFNKAVHVYLLPIDYPATTHEAAKPNYNWSNPGEVTPSILSLASPLNKEAIPAEQNYSALHSFKFTAPTPRYLYIKIDKGMKGFAGFSLANNFTTIIQVPEYPHEISFLHKGSLLALSGEKKLSVLIRGLPAVKFDFARVLPNNVNQLITQTQGDFNNPYFINPSFNQQNISEIYSDIQQFDHSDLAKQQYTALDLSKYLIAQTNTMGPQGLFLLQATGWDVTNQTALDVKASRLILITDFGMLVKDNNDGSHDVFVDSITKGMPVSGVTVTVLGKNGLPVLSRVTDAQGRVNFPALKDFVEEREPTVYLASMDNDVSFIPFNNYNRQLNFSKFDIGGIYTNNQELQSLSAYLFSDRGIYRPGDTIHIGMIVKQAYVQPQPGGLPLQVTVQDSRGTTIKDEKLTLNDSGYMELDVTTHSNSPTGQYSVNLFLIKDNKYQNLLGSASVRVSEFQPDRMRITANLIPAPSDGWSSPIALKANVGLWNLYGAPATDRKVSAKIILTPQKIEFAEYPDYSFADPLFDPKKTSKIFNETLTDATTNSEGHAEFHLNLERFEQATYQLTFFAEGFEADGGRSVTTQSKVLVSPLPYFIGYKPDGDLSFIKQNSKRTVNYIAINPQLSKEEINDLKIELTSLYPVSTLVKKSDGTYQYQSVMQSSVLSTSPLVLPEKGVDYVLPTGQIGDFSLKVIDKNAAVLSQLKYSVVGASQQPLAKNAELSVKLNKEHYRANEDIELQITAPYTGSGLITLERDKVYATQWFKTETTNSVQTIHIPADFQGNGYVNVAFIRDWESPELFISPLSYSVVPFHVSHEQHDIKIELHTPDVGRPGEPFAINYHTDKQGKIIVFAVDEGILQVANYHTPDPLAFFFQKHALEVLTQQTVDQILPKFIQDRELSAVGGDDGEQDMASRLNPFKRKTDLPVVFWSGIIDTNTTERQLVYQVPDYFNGTLKVMAVAVSNDSIGATEHSASIRGNFIINPNVPTFVAPGDEFEISSSIANNVKNSGEHSEVTVTLVASPEIEMIGATKQTLEISEGHEQTVHFKLRAKSLLGAAKVTFNVQSTDKSAKMDATLSVRPANQLMTHLKTGKSQDKSKTFDIIQTFYPHYHHAESIMSTSPLIFVFGLQRYLDNFPYGCTEQLTSKALPLLAMQGKPWFTHDNAQINDKINTTMQMLSQRQMSSGGFSYWPGLGENQGNTFASIYAIHFLTEAKNQGFNVPGDLFYNAINYLKDFASQNPADMDKARLQAYAIYILTRNEIVTTNYLANLQLYLQQNRSKEWQKEITGVYIAASYQLLKSYADANQLIREYQPQNKQTYNSDFYSSSISDAQYLYIVAKHFPDLLSQVEGSLLMPLVDAINNNDMNTILSGYISLALGAYQENDGSDSAPRLTMTEIFADQQTKELMPEVTSYQKLEIPESVKQIQLNNPDKIKYFYQLIQSGFDKTLPTQTLSNGMEIFREYLDEKGNSITSTSLGSEIEVHLKFRALNNQYLTNIAIEDLLPGGFEVIRDSVKSDGMDFADAREDRVNYFGAVDSSLKEVIYKIKAINPGRYIVPPAYAESMYNSKVQAQGTASTIIITAK